ncbi:MAG: DUF4038 domain-containing protein [Bacteroidales bacterium]|nr:DUF4038 domain-containing protein [Bacteroidales bacterium]
MKKIYKLTGVIVVFLFCLNTLMAQKFPLKVSENGRYFTDQEGKPFFYMAETPWLLIQHLTREEIIEFMDLRKEQGFNVLQIHLLPFIPINRPNRYGEWPFTDFDFQNQ